MTFNLNIVKDFFNKIISGENLTGKDIEVLIFDKNFNLPDDFITSEEFVQIVEAFNFNGDNKVDIEDFKYLKDHIQDMGVILRLIRIITLIIGKFCKKRNINIDSNDMIDIIIRIIVYCVLFIVAGNCEEFRKWAVQTNINNQTNADILFDILSEVIEYIKSASEIKKIVDVGMNFFKEKIIWCKNLCTSRGSDEQKIQNANIEIRSLKSQLNKEYKMHQISKKLNNKN